MLAAWAQDAGAGAAAFRDAHGSSGVVPPDTSLLAWGSIMGTDESRAFEMVERALGHAVAAGELVPGHPRRRSQAASITEMALTQPLDIPPGQTLVGLVTTERVGRWIHSARHPLHQQWRASVAYRLLHPVEPPADPGTAVAPMRWLLDWRRIPAEPNSPRAPISVAPRSWLRLLQGRVEAGEFVAVIGPVLVAQGWSTRRGPLTPDEVSSAAWRPLRWWRSFGPSMRRNPPGSKAPADGLRPTPWPFDQTASAWCSPTSAPKPPDPWSP